MISVIIPSRGRPESLFRAVSSFVHPDVEIVVGLDEDDPTALQACRLLPAGVRAIVAPRHESLPALQNTLASQATGDFILPMSDDYTVVQPDWVERVERELAKLPGGLGIVHLHDPVYPGFTTFPVIPRKLVEMQGFLMAPWFPFLFTDTWWDEIGTLCGIKLACSASVALDPETGHEHRYRDLALWAALFDVLRPLRVRLAIEMVDAIRDRLEPEIHERIVSTMPERAAGCSAFHARWTGPADIDRLEAMGSYPDSPRYQAMKARAVDCLPLLKELEAA